MDSKKKKIFSLLVFLALSIFLALLTPSSLGLGLNGQKLGVIVSQPGQTITNHYTLTGVEHQVEVSLSGDLTEHIALSEVVDNGFDLTIHFPETPLQPGTYYFTLSAAEVPDPSSSGLGAFVGVSKQFQVEVYSYEKDITASLSAPSVNENGTVNLVIAVQSRTYSKINSLKGEIQVYDAQNKPLARLTTQEKSLPSLALETLGASFDTTGLTAGEYSAQATIFYDGQRKEVKTNFNIGRLDLLLRNYTSQLERGFAEFRATVFNNWGNELRNVYAKLFIEEAELLQTPSLSLGPWQEGELQSIAKIELEPGEYGGRLKLFFEGEAKEEPLHITIVEKISPEQRRTEVELSKKNRTIQFLIVGLIVLTALILFILKKRKTGSNEF